MTDNIKRYTKETYLAKFNEVTKGLEVSAIIDKFTTVDDKIVLKCKHGEREILGWQALTIKHCCRKGYYESGKMWQSRKKSINKWKNELKEVFSDLYDLTNLRKVENKEKLILRCNIHGEFEQWTSSLRKGIGCPTCSKIKMQINGVAAAKKNFIDNGAYLKGRCNVSKAETNWLNELNVPKRQYLIPETGQTVDGYDPTTNTVYLYHGRYWHGCPETFDEEEIHPSLNRKMKDIYNDTILYENKIKDAGYNLIIKWG